MASDESKTKQQLLEELADLRTRVHTLERHGGPEFGRIAAIKELEARVRERNLELERANKLLKIEVAERVQAEKRLREAEHHYQALFDSTVVGLYRSTPEGRLEQANQAFADMLGYDSPARLMSSVTDIATTLYANPEDRKRRLDEAQQAGNVLSGRIEFRRRDGSTLLAHVDKHIVRDEHGAIRHFVGLVRDITDSHAVQEQLRRSEERLRTVADFTYDWEYWRAPDGRLLWVSPACERISGYRADEFMADPGLLAQIIHPDDQPMWDAHVVEEAQQQDSHNFDLRIRTKSGGVRWIGHNCVAVFAEDGTFLGRRGSNHDITLRKQREEELSEQFAFIQTLIDAAPNPIFYKDTEGVYLGCNAAFCAFRGMPRDRIIGRTLPDVVEAELAELHHRVDRKILADGRPRTYSHQDLRDPGRVRHHMVSKAPFTSTTGTIMGIIGVITDITEQREAEGQLRKLQQAVEQSPVSIVITDTGGTIEYVNPHFCALTGYTREEALGATPGILNSGHHPPEHYRELWTTVLRGEEWRGELVNRKKNGELYWEQSIISPVKNAEGEITHFVAVKEDITQRKHAEQELTRSETRYRQVVEGTDNIITRVDADGRFTFLNRAAEELYGLREDEWRNMPAFDLVHPNDQAATREAFRQWVEARVERVIYENRQRAAGGSYRDMAWNIQLQYDEGGNLAAVNSIARDITEQKHLEKLRQDVDRITRHDLKSPLMGILSVPQLLLGSDNLTDEQRSLLESMEESGLRMLSMINLSLDLYKMEVGTYQFQPQAINLVPVVRKALDDAIKWRRRKKLTGVVLLDGEPPAADARFRVLAEELLCYSLFANLLTNAAEAAPEGGTVSVDLSVRDGRARASIHNLGVVPEGIRTRFFDKYATAGKSDGTGLGTYSAKLIAETQGGAVELVRSDEDGTVVRVTLQVQD